MKKIKTLTKEAFKKMNDGVAFWKTGFHVIISCQYIQTWEQLAEALGNAFQFPMRNEGLDGTWDWLTDLTWLGKQDRICIYFFEAEKLLQGNIALKEQVLNFFEDVIQFWKEDVKTAFIEGKRGKPKSFEVYLVE